MVRELRIGKSLLGGFAKPFNSLAVILADAPAVPVTAAHLILSVHKSLLGGFFVPKAAGQGHMEAQYNLACCCKKGEGTHQDYDRAMEWFTRAANQGYANAQYNIGFMYKNGEGVEQDSEELPAS